MIERTPSAAAAGKEEAVSELRQPLLAPAATLEEGEAPPTPLTPRGPALSKAIAIIRYIEAITGEACGCCLCCRL